MVEITGITLFVSAIIVAGSVAAIVFCKFIKNNGIKSEYKSSKEYVVRSTCVEPNNKLIDYVNGIIKRKDNTSDISVNSNLVKECSSLLSPLTATSKEIFKLHKYLVQFISMDLMVKISVQYNLFSHTIKQLGTQKHIKILNKIISKNELGCFALTELGTGVSTGSVINTNAIWDDDNKQFILNTPNKYARKQWITQGKTADYMIIYAKLFYKGISSGVHPFLIKMNDYNVEKGQYGFIDQYLTKQDPSSLSNTIIIEDMSSKQCLKGVDHVGIHFGNIKIKPDGLLDSNYTINNMLLQNKTPPTFFKQMNSLVIGRICIAGGALELLKKTYIYVNDYVNKHKICLSKSGNVQKMIPLIELGHVNNLMNKIKFEIEKMELYIGNIEDEYSCIMDDNHIGGNGEIKGEKKLSYKFLEKVNICKSYIPQKSILYMREMCDIIGSKVMDIDSPLNLIERMYVTTITEGESRILSIKLGLDNLKRTKFYQISSFNQLLLKYSYYQTGGDNDLITKWYLNNTDKLHELGMNIAQNEIFSA